MKVAVVGVALDLLSTAIPRPGPRLTLPVTNSMLVERDVLQDRLGLYHAFSVPYQSVVWYGGRRRKGQA